MNLPTFVCDEIKNIQNCNMTLGVFTFKTVSPELLSWFWEASLISVSVHGPHTKQASTTLRSGHCNRMSHAAIREPAIVTFVQALSPGSMELARGCQGSIPLLTLFTGLFKSHLMGHRSIVDLTWNEDSKMQ